MLLDLKQNKSGKLYAKNKTLVMPFSTVRYGGECQDYCLLECDAV